MGINIKKHWEDLTADEMRELYQEKTEEDFALIKDLYIENEQLKAVNKEVKSINWILAGILFIFIMTILTSTWFAMN